ncbi:hypothetical protein CC79DRAFT_1334132, partial [Sarocladium strictum]
TPVRRPSTPTQSARPKARPRGRVEIIKRKQLSIQQNPVSKDQKLPPPLQAGREDQGIHSRVSRICTHQPGWILRLF